MRPTASDDTATRATLSAPIAPPAWGELLGAGRSGVVYKSTDPRGRSIARKIFESGPVTKIVQYVFLGSPNPYAWNRDAAQTALLRRQLLHPLVRFWFGDKLRVARAWGVHWNAHYSAFQIDTEFVDGDPPSLRHPLSERGAGELDELTLTLLPRLQTHLLDSGFVGSVWQAGLGNPVALGNFLVERSPQTTSWAWIDLESGVPALFPSDPRALLRHYLPASFKLMRPLFDDVDVARLRRYVDENAAVLTESLGAECVLELQRNAAELARHQHAWKSLRRLDRSITCQLMKGRIDAAEATWYRSRPMRWISRESIRVGAMGWRFGIGMARRAIAMTRRFPYARALFKAVRFFGSQAYRARLARRFVGARLHSWQRRRQLLPTEANAIRAMLAKQEASLYLTDFSVHIAIKPFVKAVEYFVVPTLFAWGLVDPALVGIALLAGGSLARSIYTLGRCVQASINRVEVPWVALGVGALPVLGNLAYPLQIVYSSTDEDDALAQFILYDGCSTIGRRLPIWGGKDTLTEHAFNRLADYVVRWRKRRRR